MAEEISPISHLEKVITGQESPISHLEKVIALYGAGGSGGSGTGTTNYNTLLNKPSINGVDLIGNKTLADLGITNYDDKQVKKDITDLQNNKVDKVIGKSLVDDTEITRLAGINNYNDTQVKTDIDDLQSDKQDKTDNALNTTDKTVTGAINEVNGNQLDTVGFSADYKNIILNRKNGLNPYVIPIASIIHNAKIIELNDVDSANIGDGKTLVYDGTTKKHKYVDSTGTDELVKMDSTTDAKHLSELIDKSTIVNDNGILKVKKLDGQEVTIAEINYLKGLTMNVMDLVNMFANGGVKIINTPVATYADLLTYDKTSFIDGITYIIYVLSDETHDNAKTTYLIDKTTPTPTFFGNAGEHRDFTTNPIDLANEVTGKLGTSNIDVDNLWSLLTINDTYKTLTTKDEVFGTHGAKSMYDELVTAIGNKANATDLTTHTDDTDIHITSVEREAWNNKANDNEVIKKTDIKTTLDENSTNVDVCGGKAIFDAIKKNCVGKETVLYEGSITATGTYTLADDVNNYDFIVINHTQNSIIYRQSNVLTKSEISKCIDKNNKFLCVYGDGSASNYTTGYFNNNNVIISDYHNENITSITGYKFGQITVQNTITNPSPAVSYSTDEQLTGGTWIDGKTIYRKTWTGTGNPSSFNHNIDSLGDVIKIDGCFLNTSSQWINFTGADNDTGIYSCRAMVTATKITFTIRNYNMKKYTLSVEYTKTTD